MASYFDLSPQKAAAAASIEGVSAEERRQLGALSLLSPQVSQLLDDLENEHSSSSEEGSLSEEEVSKGEHDKKHDTSPIPRQDKEKHPAEQPTKPSSLSPRWDSPKVSPRKGSGNVKVPQARPGAGSAKQKQPHMARFHSLRSVLFQANIQDKMLTATEEDCKREVVAANKWRSQHEQRQIHRQKTPEKATQGKDGIGSRLKTTLRRMTSKEVPTMGQISEDEVAQFDDNASTASSFDEQKKQDASRKPRDADEESMNHSDVEDLMRWVSRRHPPSDSEAKKDDKVQNVKEDSGHESLGNTDVEDLVRWVSRRSESKPEEELHTGYSDASTESDNEGAKPSSDEEENADDLVRWISHRDGPKAGPVRRKLERRELDSEVEEHYDSDVPELSGWFKRHDDTSGESAISTPVFEFEDPIEEPERGRPRSRQGSGVSLQSERKHLTHDDVDELVRWVSHKEIQLNDDIVPESDDRALQLRQQEHAKKQQLGMSVDEGSLSHIDVQDLVAHARKCSGNEPDPLRHNEIESGNFHTLKDERTDSQNLKRDEIEKKQALGMSLDDGS